MKINNLIQPNNIDEAYEILNSGKNNFILGGCCFLRMGNLNINKAIDISKLNLDFIEENDEFIEIGAMTPFRKIEISKSINENFSGILSKAVSNIVGIQFRNLATIGGTVYSRYGFSDLITALLVLDTTVFLYKGGEILLEKFLEKGAENNKDILLKVRIKKNKGKYCFLDMRNSKSDYAILNSAVSNEDGKFRIVIGARPGRAKLSEKASEFLSENELSDININNSINIMSEEIKFGTNFRGSAEYRKEISKVLIRRCIMEVSK
jgi:CO/xanthine dehydrogenase FAD-binding subunit